MKALLSLSRLFLGAVVVASIVSAHPHPGRDSDKYESVSTKGQEREKRPAPVGLKPVNVNGVSILANTSAVAQDTRKGADKGKKVEERAISATSVSSTVLVIARDDASAYSGYSGLLGYAIPYQVLLVPKTGTSLPALSSGTTGNFGAIVVLSEVSYDYGTAGFQSALSAAQWQDLYTYQSSFGVRMVRIDVFPSPDSGTTALGGCCNTGVEQLISISNNAAFPSAGLKTLVVFVHARSLSCLTK
jgi:hypothetical protein